MRKVSGEQEATSFYVEFFSKPDQLISLFYYLFFTQICHELELLKPALSGKLEDRWDVMVARLQRMFTDKDEPSVS
jgi:hypothetical protein